MKDDPLELKLPVGDHCRPTDLGAGTRGRGHCDYRRHQLAADPPPVIADILKSHSGRLLADHQCHRLARVQRRSAAKGDNSVVIARAVGQYPVVHMLIRGVAEDPRKQTATQPPLGAKGHRSAHHGRIRQPGIRDQQRRLDPKFPTGRRQLGNCAYPGANGRR